MRSFILSDLLDDDKIVRWRAWCAARHGLRLMQEDVWHHRLKEEIKKHKQDEEVYFKRQERQEKHGRDSFEGMDLIGLAAIGFGKGS